MSSLIELPEAATGRVPYAKDEHFAKFREKHLFHSLFLNKV